MSTVRRQIMQKIGEALAGVPGVNLYESVDDAVEAGKLPAMVYGWSLDRFERFGGLDKHTLSVNLQAMCKGAEAEDDADAILIAGWNAIIGTRLLDGLVTARRKGDTVRDGTVEGTKILVLTQQCEFEYLTQRNSLTERG